MFDRICAALSLGEMTAPPLRLQGGYTHRMFRLTTRQGEYAVKLLNPEIMARPDAMNTVRTAEGCEVLLEAAGLPVLPALIIGGRKMQHVDGQYLYVFPFYGGRVLREAEITPAHCARIGQALAGIHAVAREDSPQPSGEEACGCADWTVLADALLASADAQAEGAALRDASLHLTRLTEAARAASSRLAPVRTLCHNDMDAKNVLWQDGDFRIIDLECIGLANPEQELLDLAISWAGDGPEEARFRALVESYCAAGGRVMSAPADIFDSRCNHLDWLAYNARRALFDDPEERRIGREQVLETIGKINWDQQNRQRILCWMEESLDE